MLRRARVSSEHLMHESFHFGLRKRSQSLHGEDAEPQQRLLGAAQDRIEVALGFVVSAEEHDLVLGDLAGDEVKELQRRRVRPLQVFQDDEEWLLGGQSPQKLGEVPEKTRLYLRGIRSHRCSLAAARG